MGEFKTLFAAIATPTLPETLAWAADTQFRRIVVPAAFAVHRRSARPDQNRRGRRFRHGPIKEWMIAAYLGPSPLVADAIVDMARRATMMA